MEVEKKLKNNGRAIKRIGALVAKGSAFKGKQIICWPGKLCLKKMKQKHISHIEISIFKCTHFNVVVAKSLYFNWFVEKFAKEYVSFS